MKNKMLLPIGLLLFLGACRHDPIKKEPTGDDWRTAEGHITGFDYRKCWCCSGYFFKTVDTTYLFYMPVEGGIEVNEATLPVPVKVTFKPDTTVCWTTLNLILVYAIKKI